MQTKKTRILAAALSLFAMDGFCATTTTRIAEEAGVSEGLIFKHFPSKKALLDEIYSDAERKLNNVFASLLFLQKPTKVIRTAIELPFHIREDEYDFWRLLFKLKWEDEYYNPEKMQPLIGKLTWAFEELEYLNPEKEAVLLNHLIESLAIQILRDGRTSQIQFKKFLLNKYEVS